MLTNSTKNQILKNLERKEKYRGSEAGLSISCLSFVNNDVISRKMTFWSRGIEVHFYP